MLLMGVSPVWSTDCVAASESDCGSAGCSAIVPRGSATAAAIPRLASRNVLLDACVRMQVPFARRPRVFLVLRVAGGFARLALRVLRDLPRQRDSSASTLPFRLCGLGVRRSSVATPRSLHK